MTEIKGKKTGLALGGGMALGGAHIGVLRALDELDIEISYLAGTSIGALIAAFYAFGTSWERIRELTVNIEWMDITGMSLSQYGLLSNEKICAIIEKELGEVLIEEAQIPLAVIATDISSGKRIIIRKGPVAEAVRASTCIPGIYVPVERENRLLVDGGLVENVPVTAVREMGAEYVIGVDLNAKQRFKKPENIAGVLINTVTVAMNNITRLHQKDVDLMITPDTSTFSLFDTEQTADLIEQGYRDARKALNNVQ